MGIELRHRVLEPTFEKKTKKRNSMSRKASIHIFIVKRRIFMESKGTADLLSNGAPFPLPQVVQGLQTRFSLLVCAGGLCAVFVRVPDMQNNANSSPKN